MLIANGKNMQNDILISGSVLLGPGIHLYFQNAHTRYYLCIDGEYMGFMGGF